MVGFKNTPEVRAKQAEKMRVWRAAKYAAEGHVPKRTGRPPRPEEERLARKAETAAKKHAWSLEYKKNRRAEKAIAEGREPGKVGGDPLPSEELYARRLATHAEYRARNLEAIRKRDAERARQKRAERSLAKAQGVVVLEGTPRKLNVSIEEKVFRIRTSGKEHGDVHTRNRRARLKNAEGKHSAEDIRMLFARQKGKCAFCLKPLGKLKPHVDHYMPLVLGGSNDPSNLRLLHKTCNLKKGKSDPVEFAQRNGILIW